jgi:N-acetylglucosamine malate deacetylase 2
METGLQHLLSPDPSPTLVVVAHPDDETIGAGALISGLPDCWIVHITDGAPREPRFLRRFVGSREEYATARQRELAAALDLAGIGPERRCVVEGIADQEACFALPRLAHEIVRLCRELRPGVLLTLTYEGGHPDHDAAAFAAWAAAELLRRNREVPPAIVEMPLYHARPGSSHGDDMVKQEFLPTGESVRAVATMRRELSSTEQGLKIRMADCFTTQRTVLSWFLPPVYETFRPAPVYDFTRPPHEGTLQYELWSFPVTGERWRTLAREALKALQLTPEPARRGL